MSRDVAPTCHLAPRATRSPSVVAPDGPSNLSAMHRPRPSRAEHDFVAGGLRVTRGAGHEPVMVAEIVEAFVDTPQGVILDATVGAGGHARAILEASTRHRLIGIDRDPVAVAAASESLAPFGGRARVLRRRFDQLAEVAAELAEGEPVSGVLFDLGVSSMQFDEAERGFSYRFDAPLDMRMDPSEELSAAGVVNEWPEAVLAELFAANGEPRFARRLAAAIVRARPIATTGELSEVVRSALPGSARARGGHPAKRVFQAVRVAVNDELELLPAALDTAMSLLVPGGRIAVLSYHSGEDRIVKRAFANAATGWCRCPQGLPCVCGAIPAVRVLSRGARMPKEAEVAANPRASSARLRVAERLSGPWRRPGGQGEEA